MRIGLINVDGSSKKKKWGAKIYPNLALGKIARYHKQQGDVVEWAEPYGFFNEEPYDVLYASKVFNFSPDIDFSQYKYNELVKGGTGYDVNKELPTEIDRLQPDYTMFPTIPNDTAYGFLTRGCPRKCSWCVVPRKEGAVHKYMDIEEIAIEGRKNIVLMDNNILAIKDYAIEQMEKAIKLGLKIDFNQAMDARLVEDDLADVMAKVKWLESNRIRFGCDTKAQIEECERAILMLEQRGFKGQIFLYTMLHGSFEECYERIKHWQKRNLDVRKYHDRCYVYPHSQPFRDTIKPNVIPQWQKDLTQWCNKRQYFVSFDFKDFSPRKNFKCSEYFK